MLGQVREPRLDPTEMAAPTTFDSDPLLAARERAGAYVFEFSNDFLGSANRDGWFKSSPSPTDQRGRENGSRALMPNDLTTSGVRRTVRSSDPAQECGV